jgi:hypothetical protein
MVGAAWITTRQAEHHSGEAAARRSVMVGAGLSLPLWQGAYQHDVQEARATEAERQAAARALDQELQAEVEAAWVDVKEANRRVRWLSEVLLPQAEAQHQASLGALAASGEGLAQALEAQDALLTLQLEHARERANLERSWIDLELRCGSPLERQAGGRSP